MRYWIFYLLILANFSQLPAQKLYRNLGVEVNPNFTIPSFVFASSWGLFYDQPLSRSLYIQTGLHYSMIGNERPGFCLGGPCIDRIVRKFGNLEVPFNLALKVTHQVNMKSELFLIFGYAYGKNIRHRAWLTYEDGDSQRSGGWGDFSGHIHTGKLGFEVRRRFNDKWMFAFGGLIKITDPDPQTWSLISNWNLVIKVGRSWEKGKKMFANSFNHAL